MTLGRGDTKSSPDLDARRAVAEMRSFAGQGIREQSGMNVTATEWKLVRVLNPHRVECLVIVTTEDGSDFSVPVVWDLFHGYALLS